MSRPKRVFVSGCWDMTHVGHLAFLEFAKAQGDTLIVSVAPDKTIRLLKREPVVPEWHRLRMIAALKPVDEAFIADYTENGWDDCFSYVANYRPDIWVVPEDDRKLALKQTWADKYGVELRLFYRPNDNISTTSTIKRVRSEHYVAEDVS